MTRGRIAEGVALAVLAVVGTALVFRLEWFELVYLPTALLLVIAFRIGTRGVALTGAVMAFIAAQATAEGHLYWAALDVTAATGILYLQLALAVLISAALALAAEITQRERAAFALASARESMRTASEQAALYESERDARLRAELLERHAAHLAAAMTVRDIAEATIDDLESAGITIAVMGVVRGDMVETVGSSGIARDTRERFSRFPLADASLITDTIRSGTTTTIASPEEYEARYPTFAEVRRQTGMQSITAVPLRAGSGRVIGALAVSATTAEWFDEQRRQVIAAVAGQCGVALERAQLQEDAEAVAADAAFIAELGETLDVATTARERAQRVVELLVRDGAEFAAVQHDDDEVGAVTLASASAPRPPSQDGDDAPPEDSQALTTLPLRARGRLVGTLTVRFDADPTHGMSSSHLREIATRTAIAIDNALLYERERDVSHSLQLGLLGGATELAPATDVASCIPPGHDDARGRRRLARRVRTAERHDCARCRRRGRARPRGGGRHGSAARRGSSARADRIAVRAARAPRRLRRDAPRSRDGDHRVRRARRRRPAACATRAPVIRRRSSSRPKEAHASCGRDARPRSARRSATAVRRRSIDSSPGTRSCSTPTDSSSGARRALQTASTDWSRPPPAEAGASADALVGRIVQTNSCRRRSGRRVRARAEAGTARGPALCVLVSRGSLPSWRCSAARSRDWLEKAGCPADPRRDAIVAISEVAANAVEHAYAFDGAGVIGGRGATRRRGRVGRSDTRRRDLARPAPRLGPRSAACRWSAR